MAVRVTARRHDPDEAGQHEGGKHPAVQGEAVQIARHDGHDRDDGQGFGGNEGDGQDESQSQGAAVRRPQAVTWLTAIIRRDYGEGPLLLCAGEVSWL